MPCWRQSTGVAAPASCSCKTLTICSWVNRLPRMLSSVGRIPIEDSHYPWTSFRGAGHYNQRLPVRNGGRPPAGHDATPHLGLAVPRRYSSVVGTGNPHEVCQEEAIGPRSKPAVLLEAR